MLPWFNHNSCPVFLAPMARFTDSVYRRLCKQQGADVLITEFVLADAIVRGDERVWERLEFTPDQRPIGMQIFGSEPEIMAAAARRIEQQWQPDFIDINFGCPADRVTCRDAGSSLLRQPVRLQKIVAAVVSGVEQTPVTAKIRIGWDRSSIVAVDVARRVQDAGAAAVTVHGRTKEQGYSGEADWDVIAAVVAAVGLPVIGNGSLRTAEDVENARLKYGVRGVMIGRAALGYPWLFSEIKAQLNGETVSEPAWQERQQTLLDYAALLIDSPTGRRCGGRINWMRPKLKALTKQMPGGRKLRAALDHVDTLEELEDLVRAAGAVAQEGLGGG